MDPSPGLLSSPSWVRSQPAEPSMEGERSPLPCARSRDSSSPRIQVPSSSLTDPDWFWDEHIQAKRARVETIVRGMGLSPHPLVSNSARARDSPSCPEKTRERKRKQSLPMQQNPPKSGPAGNQGSRVGGPRVREQLHLLKQQLRQLQERVLQAAQPGAPARGPGGAEERRALRSVKQRDGHGCGPWPRDSDGHPGSKGDLPGVGNHRAVEVELQPVEPRFLPSGTPALLDILRKELIGAVSQAVDSVLQKVLLGPPSPLAQLGRGVQGLVPEGRRETLPEGGAREDPLPRVQVPGQAQAQAGGASGHLPRAKPLDSPRLPVSPRTTSKPYQAPAATCLPTMPPHIQENQILSQLLGQGPSGQWSGCLLQDPPSPSHCSAEPALQPWGAVGLRLRPSVVSRRQPPVSFTPTRWETLRFLPSVKMEQGGLRAVTDVLPFPSVHIQEGLNPSHLKKAKLMFFFTRYPSSSLLKAHFPDVQFTRCITSQMIKWFSNFREFYYIQMEKFARQAISDGVTDPEVLAVLRDSELFRALNTHYNKGSDFEGLGVSGHQPHLLVLTFSHDCDHSEQLIDDSMEGKDCWHALVKCSIRMPHVPECFLEVASLTLQEFFRAVSAGKDSDPSWKKPIYKVIAKLDSDVPEIFKSSSYP